MRRNNRPWTGAPRGAPGGRGRLSGLEDDATAAVRDERDPAPADELAAPPVGTCAEAAEELLQDGASPSARRRRRNSGAPPPPNGTLEDLHLDRQSGEPEWAAI